MNGLAARLRPMLAFGRDWLLHGAVLRLEITLSGLLELVARVGYAARGFVYVSIGLIAWMAAVEWLPRAKAGRDVVSPLLNWPTGFFWAGLIGAGLLCFAGWRAAQVLLDADRQGWRPLALASRLGQAISGVVYGGLGLSVLELIDEVEDHLEGEADAQQTATAILAMPGGQWVLMGVGAFILGCGIGNIIQGIFNDFGKRLGCTAKTRRWACWVGRAGYAARGVAFLPLGAFFLEAGLDLKASAVRDLGGALQSLEGQPMGSLILSVTAAGLMAFGVFAFIEARFRRIEVAARPRPEGMTDSCDAPEERPAGKAASL